MKLNSLSPKPRAEVRTQSIKNSYSHKLKVRVAQTIVKMGKQLNFWDYIEDVITEDKLNANTFTEECRTTYSQPESYVNKWLKEANKLRFCEKKQYYSRILLEIENERRQNMNFHYERGLYMSL